jgi:hypothetical protein
MQFITCLLVEIDEAQDSALIEFISKAGIVLLAGTGIAKKDVSFLRTCMFKYYSVCKSNARVF